MGSLHLPPKPNTGSDLVSDKRPITINNSSNRIIAKVTNAKLIPLAAEFLDRSQRGFLPGRDWSEGLHHLNRSFYHALYQKHKFFILFVDFEKAFDSVSHDYLRALLSHLKVPGWAIAVVSALFTDIKVFPAFVGSDVVWIFVRRGVKQGCPLSPLLFAISLDVLLYFLSLIPDLPTSAFADALALDAAEIAVLVAAFFVFSDFSRFSGLVVNVKK